MSSETNEFDKSASFSFPTIIIIIILSFLWYPQKTISAVAKMELLAHEWNNQSGMYQGQNSTCIPLRGDTAYGSFF